MCRRDRRSPQVAKSTDNDPFVDLGALTTNENFGPSLSISHNKDPFVSLGALSTNNNFDPVHGQTQNQQDSQETVGFNPNEDLAPETKLGCSELSQSRGLISPVSSKRRHFTGSWR